MPLHPVPTGKTAAAIQPPVGGPDWHSEASAAVDRSTSPMARSPPASRASVLDRACNRNRARLTPSASLQAPVLADRSRYRARTPPGRRASAGIGPPRKPVMDRGARRERFTYRDPGGRPIPWATTVPPPPSRFAWLGGTAGAPRALRQRTGTRRTPRFPRACDRPPACRSPTQSTRPCLASGLPTTASSAHRHKPMTGSEACHAPDPVRVGPRGRATAQHRTRFGTGHGTRPRRPTPGGGHPGGRLRARCRRRIRPRPRRRARADPLRSHAAHRPRQDRVRLPRRHLDRERGWIGRPAAHRPRGAGDQSPLLSGREMDRVLVQPHGELRRLRHPDHRRRASPAHLPRRERRGPVLDAGRDRDRVHHDPRPEPVGHAALRGRPGGAGSPGPCRWTGPPPA